MYNKIVVDIDWILCETGYHQNYLSAAPKIQNIKALKNYKWYITLHTARLEEDRFVTERWLFANNVKYNELIMEKPKADLYIDDRSVSVMPWLWDDISDKRKELVICVSWWMDSVLAYEYALKELGYKKEDILCINFDISQPYFEKEKKCLDKANFDYKTIKVDLCNQELWTMPNKENYIIPGRNMVFASIWASFWKRVWIMGMKFEDHYLMYDKNSAFFALASMCTSQAIWNKTIIESPFINMSKTDALNWALQNGVSEEIISNTTSCYDPIKHRCWQCSLCFKRYIAWKAANFEEEFDVNPELSSEGDKLLINYHKAVDDNNYSHYSKERILETARVLAPTYPKAKSLLDKLK